MALNSVFTSDSGLLFVVDYFIVIVKAPTFYYLM